MKKNKLIKKFLIFALFIIQINNGQQQEKPLKVMILYESLCPDSVKFFTEQLRPNYDQFKDIIDIKLVPFGKSRSINNGQYFVCQHGPPECAGNLIQTCALAQTNDQEIQVQYGVCQMFGEADPSGGECAQYANLPINEIKKCTNSKVGTDLQLLAEAITHSYAPRFIPTIIYDEVFDQHLQEESIGNFAAVLCKLLALKGTYVTGC